MIPQTRMYNGDANCGPISQHIATGKPYQEIIKKWAGGWGGVDNDRGLLGLPNDTPADHFTTLHAMGINYQELSTNDVLDGRAIPEKTILLLHLVERPSNMFQKFLNFFRALFRQHWVVFIGYTEGGTRYILDWGYWKTTEEGQVEDYRIFNREDMERFLNAGWPCCSYVVNTATTKRLSWWRKLYAKIV